MALYDGDDDSNVANYINIYERNRLTMLGGDDSAYGGPLPDTIYGGTGNDYLVGDDGGDVLYAGSGIDTLVAGDGADYLSLDGAGLAFGRSGDDTLIGNGA